MNRHEMGIPFSRAVVFVFISYLSNVQKQDRISWPQIIDAYNQGSIAECPVHAVIRPVKQHSHFVSLFI